MSSVDPIRGVVVVLGMHRSGTSLLGSILQALGVDLGQQLIRGDSNNAAGYFEHADIVRVHKQMLEQLDRRWVGAKGTLPFPDEWWQKPEIQQLRIQLVDIVGRELAQAKGLWGFKDPRASRFIPLWKEVFRELKVTPLYLLAVRHPNAVSASIIKRDAISSARTQLLWLKHNLDALLDTRGELKRVVDYDRWFTHTYEQTRAVAAALGLGWPENDSQLLAELSQQIKPELRHHKVGNDDYLPYVAQTYELLVEAAVTGEIPDMLWHIAGEVQRAQALLQAWREVVDAAPRDQQVAVPHSAGTNESFFKRLSLATRARFGQPASR